MKNQKTLITITTILIITTLFQTCLTEKCNSNDKKVLLKIKKAFNNPYTLKSWDPQTDCCHWYCVKCDFMKPYRIKSISISYSDISGKIPAEIGELPFLERLVLRKSPNLTGPIPRSLTKLEKLGYLTIEWTGLSGEIPSFIGDIKTLEFVSLAFNRLFGPIPASLGTLPILRSLQLDRNQLSGSIPENFGSFSTEGFGLFLGHNNLSGKIPESFRTNKGFELINLSRNRLEGDASALFGPGKLTEIIDISTNLFEFDISNLTLHDRLTSLDISHNRIFGTLPEKLTQLRLQYLNVSYNRLCGRIPIGGDLQTGVKITEYFHNRCLCGAPLPECK